MENWEFKIEGEGCGLRIGNHDLRIYHATPTINTHISGQPLLQILLFWGHCKVLNLSLEGNLQLFPGLQFFMINKLNLKQLCEQTINISVRNFVCVVEYIFQRSKFWLFFFINMYLNLHLCLSFSCCIMKDFIDCDVVQAFVVIILGHFAVMNRNLRFCRVWI